MIEGRNPLLKWKLRNKCHTADSNIGSLRVSFQHSALGKIFEVRVVYFNEYTGLISYIGLATFRKFVK